MKLTVDRKLFTTVDNSKDKLTTDTFFLLFLIWAFGMVVSMVAIAVEVVIFKRNSKTKVKIMKKSSKFGN